MHSPGKNYYISNFSASLSKFASLNRINFKIWAVIQTLKNYFGASSSLSRIFNMKTTDPDAKLHKQLVLFAHSNTQGALGHTKKRYDL